MYVRWYVPPWVSSRHLHMMSPGLQNDCVQNLDKKDNVILSSLYTYYFNEHSMAVCVCGVWDYVSSPHSLPNLPTHNSLAR